MASPTPPGASNWPEYQAAASTFMESMILSFRAMRREVRKAAVEAA
jgi:hypothetical protein